MTSNEDKSKVINDARSWLCDYLYSEAEDSTLRDMNKTKLVRFMGARFAAMMQEDPELYEKVREFISKKRKAEEKRVFFHNVIYSLGSKEIAEEYAKKYPSEFRTKENR